MGEEETMEFERNIQGEENLDPADWEAMRELSHRMVDDMLDYLETVRERPVWQPIPEMVKTNLSLPLPRQPQGEQAAYEDFLELVLPHPMGNIHPRFWGWVVGTGTPLSAMAEMLAATMNPNVGGGDHVANYVEFQVIDWCKEMLGYPMDASGLLVSGGSMANLVGVIVARNTLAGFDIRKEGLQKCKHRLVCYGSVESHSSVQKAVELVGLGSDCFHQIPVNAEFQIDIPALERAITADREAGYQPFLVVGNAGTINTGAIDDLNWLADICQREKLWFHVDGAFGTVAALAPDLQHLVIGMERADSLAFDFHKWMYMPFEAGCVLVKHEEDHRKSFSLTPDYLEHTTRGLGAGTYWFSEYGVQLSRGFRALKIWLSMKAHGIDKFGRLIQQNVDQTRYLARLVDQTHQLELLAPVSLNVVCFRYNPGVMDEESLDALNKELIPQLHEGGVAVISYTTLNGKYALRACFINHRTRLEDIDLLVEEILRLGSSLAQ
jgi:glutamate/tyrosine decarboxylase-like PLP-dependent enzyme